MGLPSVGPVELIIVLVIALLVVGPRRLPDMGKSFGHTISEFRRAVSTDPVASSAATTDAGALAAEASTPEVTGNEASLPSDR